MSLSGFIREHREAVEHDLLTQTGYCLADIGSGITWSSVRSFLRQIGADSATARDLRPDLAEWATRAKTNAILADLFDLLSMMNANIVAIGSGHRAKKPKPYPRPGERNDQKHFGKDPLPAKEFREWLKEKRRKHG